MEITEIKTSLPIGRLLLYYELTPNTNSHIRCPFHLDREPSMRIYPQTNTAYCFSASCPTAGKSVDVIDFVMYKESLSKHEAILRCKEILDWKQPKQATSTTKIIAAPALAAPLTLTLSEVFASLHNGLLHCPKAQKYLQSRGLNNLDSAIGYNSGQLHHGATEAYISDLVALRLLSDSEKGGRKGYNSFAKNCVVFPLKDSLGRICSLYGRSISAKNHYYLAGRSGLYPGYPPPDTTKIILTESIIDAASLLEIKALSEYFILALYGTNGLTAEHKTALLGLPNLEEVVIMLDSDEAGKAATTKYLSELQLLLPQAKVRKADLPEGFDVNEIWANHREPLVFLELLEIKAADLLGMPAATALQPKSEPILQPKNEPALQPKPTAELNTSEAYNWTWEGSCGQHSIKGGVDIKHWEQLKITWVLETPSGLKSRLRLDLYDDRQVEKSCETAAKKLRLKSEELEKDLDKLSGLVEAHRRQLAKSAGKTSTESDFVLSAEGKKAAIEFLSTPNLLGRLNFLVGSTGIVGEEKNRLLLLLVASSYKNKRPLHALIQGSSGSGKTLLLRKIISLIPPDDCYLWSRVTESSLYNWGERLCHTVVGIEDFDGLNPESQYAFRELQTGGILRSSTSEKQENGKIEAQERITKGPIASLLCTTQGTVYEDNMNRCILVAVDESEEQTAKILNYQNQYAEGKIDREAEETNRVLVQNLVKVLEAAEVVNPYAGRVKLPPKAHKIRRLNQLYQDFVAQVVCWHQFQRKKDEKGRLIAEPADLQAAAELLFDCIVLKVDELDGSLRFFFEQLKAFVLAKELGEDYTFSRLEVRQALRLSKTQQHRFFTELEEFEYIKVLPGNRYRGNLYQISFWDDYESLRLEIKENLAAQIKDL